MIFDRDQGQDVIYYTTPPKKQIRVEPGTKVDEFKDTNGRLRAAGNGGR